MYSKGPDFSALNQVMILILIHSAQCIGFCNLLVQAIIGTPGIEALELNDQTFKDFSRRGPAAPQVDQTGEKNISIMIC